MKKLALLAAVGLGYVLGTRAGRGRYEQMKAQAEKVWNTEPVQHTYEAAKDAAGTAATGAAHKVAETAKDVGNVVTEKVKTAADFAKDGDSDSDAVVANTIRTTADSVAADADAAAAAADAEVAFGGDESASDSYADAANVLSTEADDLHEAADSLANKADAEAAFTEDAPEGDKS